jgi:transposase-like protein
MKLHGSVDTPRLECSTPKKQYPPEFRRRMVEHVRAGRTPASPAKDFEPFAQTIANWPNKSTSTSASETTVSARKSATSYKSPIEYERSYAIAA